MREFGGGVDMVAFPKYFQKMTKKSIRTSVRTGSESGGAGRGRKIARIEKFLAENYLLVKSKTTFTI